VSTDGDPVAGVLERAYRDEWSAVVATLARRLGDLQAAEDAAGEAFAAAALHAAAWFAAIASAAGGYGQFVAPLLIAGIGISTSVTACTSCATPDRTPEKSPTSTSWRATPTWATPSAWPGEATEELVRHDRSRG
jgi:hypothetical protein